MIQRGQKIIQRCPTCIYSLKKGHLWLGGNDYLKCPDCNGTTEFIMFERKVTPASRVFLVERN